MSHILKQTRNFQLGVCLSMCDLLVDTKYKKVRTTAVLLHDNLNDPRNSIYCQSYSMAFENIKIFKPPISRAKRKAPTNISKISILNKDVELIIMPYNFS